MKKRLTKKDVEECAASVIPSLIGRVCGKALIKQIMSELLEYKCIEEELGVDLVTLFKALKNGVYYDDGSGVIQYYEVNEDQYIDIDIHNQFLNLMYTSQFERGCLCEMSLPLNTHDKTWAITKEGLKLQ